LRPASYDEVITVSALSDTDGKPGGLGGNFCYSWGTYDHDDVFASFSNYGGDVDLIAPGKCIRSTLPGGLYGYMSGTSMAAPLVTGAAALYKSTRPNATPAQVRAALRAAGTLDWNVATDPDSTHEPLLDVSHIVPLGDFTVDATPGTSHGGLVGAAGGTVQLPVQLFRAEDFPGQVDLTVTAAAPLTASLDPASLAGQDQVATSMTITVPPETASGTYQLVVTASDGTRQRTSSVPVTVDGVPPVASAPVLALQSGTLFRSNAVAGIGTWSPATDAVGTVSGYEAQWRVDGGGWGGTIALGAGTRQSTRSMTIGHTYALRVRARDVAGNWSDWAEGPGFRPGISQDTSSTLVRRGTWTRFRASWMSGGTSLYSRQRGASVTRPFTGRAVALVASLGPIRGKAQIWVDGAYVGTVNLYRSVSLHRVLVYSRAWASPGRHSLRVVVLGTAGHPRVDVDAFVIVP